MQPRSHPLTSPTTRWGGAPGRPLVGRDTELAELCQQLEPRAVRLLTLVGPPGVGRTELARLAGWTLDAHFEDGACFVPLAAIHDAALVLPAIARALGVHEADRQPSAEELANWLHGRELLLVLDNFEQLRSAARDVAWLLVECPRLAVLVTWSATITPVIF